MSIAQFDCFDPTSVGSLYEGSHCDPVILLKLFKLAHKTWFHLQQETPHTLAYFLQILLSSYAIVREKDKSGIRQSQCIPVDIRIINIYGGVSYFMLT